MEITTSDNITGTSTGTSMFDPWSPPVRVEIHEYSDRIEMVYKQTQMITYTSGFPTSAEERVFKIVFSCVDGKFNKSVPIFGKIVPQQSEYYEFEE